MKEIWRDVKGYEGLYKVSNKGRVLSLSRQVRCKGNGIRCIKQRVLKQEIDHLGYCFVSLHKGLKQYTEKVHRLVGIAFIENPNNYAEINHRDENPSNNNLENLEWCDHLYNSRYGTRGIKLSKANINNIFTSLPVIQYTKDGQMVKEFPSIQEASRETGIANGSICWACKGKLLSAGGFIWNYR